MNVLGRLNPRAFICRQFSPQYRKLHKTKMLLVSSAKICKCCLYLYDHENFFASSYITLLCFNLIYVHEGRQHWLRMANLSQLNKQVKSVSEECNIHQWLWLGSLLVARNLQQNGMYLWNWGKAKLTFDPSKIKQERALCLKSFMRNNVSFWAVEHLKTVQTQEYLLKKKGKYTLTK